MRDRTAKAIAFGKLLRKDLEVAAEFCVTVDLEVLMKTLRESGHSLVDTPHTANYLILAPSNISHDVNTIQALLDVTCGRDEALMNAPIDSCPREGMIRCRSFITLLLTSIYLSNKVCIIAESIQQILKFLTFCFRFAVVSR